MGVPTRLDTELVRNVHRMFVTGVTVVTAGDNGVPRGLAVNAFSSISLEPPLVLVCVQKTSNTYLPLFRSQYLAVSILSADQLEIAKRFASKEPNKFESVPWHWGGHGAPIIGGSCAYIEVEITERLEASTHTAFVGLVVDANHFDRVPLVYYGGQFIDPSAALTAI